MSEELKVGVGLSRKWDAREAGREVAETTLEKMDGENPKFFLLFSTIHYEKYGGFQELLNGVWDVLPEGTALIGGTVAGFMTREGVFSRGVAALATSGNFNVSSGFSEGVRKNPKKASIDIANKIGKNNSLVMVFPPGPSMPNVKGGEKLIVTKSKTMAKLAPRLLEISTTRLNKGVGREMEILEELSRQISSDIVGSSTIDDNRYDNNYQFFINRFFSDAIVSIGLDKINYDLYTMETMPIPKSWYKVSKKKAFDHVVEEIEGKKALSVYMKELGYMENMIFDEPHLVHRRFVFVPAVTKDEHGGYHPRCPGTFYGGSLGFGHPIFDYIGFSSTNGEYILNSFTEFYGKYNAKEVKFLLVFSCAVLFEALGSGAYIINEKLRDIYGGDYLMLFGGGEIFSTRETYKGPKILEMSLTGVGFY